ncbi:MAG: hypothetical protein ACXVPN_02085, partial [Bacteroidia bacterium]
GSNSPLYKKFSDYSFTLCQIQMSLKDTQTQLLYFTCLLGHSFLSKNTLYNFLIFISVNQYINHF